MKNQNSVIDIKNITKTFNKTTAVSNLTFNIKKGEIFGFLGPNGAGKTTTIKAMLGLLYPDKGSILINGYDIFKYGKSLKKKIGYMPELVAFYDNLTAIKNLEFYAELKNIPKKECRILLSDLGLEEHINKRVGGFSKGMKQRLGLARAILGNPSIIILDEPTSGLDPRGVKLIRDKIKQIANTGTTFFISSHILSEIEAVCTQIGIINRGILTAQDNVNSLRKKLLVKPKIFLKLYKINDKIIDAVKQIKEIYSFETRGDVFEILCEAEYRSKVVVTVEKAGGKIIDLWTKEASLEDVFMKLTET